MLTWTSHDGHLGDLLTAVLTFFSDGVHLNSHGLAKHFWRNTWHLVAIPQKFMLTIYYSHDVRCFWLSVLPYFFLSSLLEFFLFVCIFIYCVLYWGFWNENRGRPPAISKRKEKSPSRVATKKETAASSVLQVEWNVWDAKHRLWHTCFGNN